MKDNPISQSDSLQASSLRFRLRLVACGLRLPLVLLVFGTCLHLRAEDIQTVNDQAHYLFEHRHLDPVFVDSEYQLLANARPNAPADERALELWAQVNVELGDRPRPKADKIRYYRVAQVAAETLKTINPDNAAGHFWWAAAYGDIGMAQGSVLDLTRISSVRKELQRTLALDSDFTYAYAVLGDLYRDLPGVMGGDPGKARRYYLAGLTRFPNFTILHFELAQLDIKQGDSAAARVELNQILSESNPFYEAAYELHDKPEAQKLLAQIGTE